MVSLSYYITAATWQLINCINTLHLSWDNEKLRAICEDKVVAIEELGDHCTQRLHARLADLFAATSIHDLHVGNLQVIGEAPFNHCRLELDNEHHLIFCSAHPKMPLHEDGNLNWQEVSRIKLIDIKKSA